MKNIITLLLILTLLVNTTSNAAIPVPTNQIEVVADKVPVSLKRDKQSIVQKVLSLITKKEEPDEKPKIKGTDGFAVISFLASLLGIFIAGLLLGAIGFGLGLTALRRIGDGSQRGGRGLAIAGMIIGVIAFFGALIVIGSL